jgi:hypothetical protein
MGTKRRGGTSGKLWGQKEGEEVRGIRREAKEEGGGEETLSRAASFKVYSPSLEHR